jgi:hypothetical protein
LLLYGLRANGAPLVGGIMIRARQPLQSSPVKPINAYGVSYGVIPSGVWRLIKLVADLRFKVVRNFLNARAMIERHDFAIDPPHSPPIQGFLCYCASFVGSEISDFRRAA